MVVLRLSTETKNRRTKQLCSPAGLASEKPDVRLEWGQQCPAHIPHSLTHISPVLVAPTSHRDPSPPSSPICSVTCEPRRGSQAGLCGAVHGDASQVLHAAALTGCPALPCPSRTAFLLVLPLANSTSARWLSGTHGASSPTTEHRCTLAALS